MNGTDRQEGRLDVLLVEDNPADALFVRMAVESSSGVKIEITESARLADALRALEAKAFDLVLLDLGLPDSQGLPTFSVLHARFPLVPVVVLSALADETTTLSAVRLGAQDFLIKGEFDAALLVRVMRHTMERHNLLRQLERSLAYARKLLPAIEPSTGSGTSEDALVLCSRCNRLRAAPDRWETIEEYLAQRAQAQLTHETCPDCATRIKP